MDRVREYRNIIKRIITEYAQFNPSYGDINAETVFDEERDHYQLVYEGWNGFERVHGSVIHVDIRNDKVWIQHDGTEDGIAEELVDAGIPRDHIVLGFHLPEKRKYTEFAVA
jgi:hypothetical protein